MEKQGQKLGIFNFMNFFKQFIKDPITTGAIVSSSKDLSELITQTARLDEKKCVVELGPGIGVFTKEIMRRISPQCVFFCLEINQQLVEATRKNCPQAIVYHASAQEIKKYLLQHHQNSCDCIISGLSWALFDQPLQDDLLNALYDSLEPGGVFLTFAYIHGPLFSRGNRFRKLLNIKFKKVEKTKIIWKNILPAFVYYCTK